MWGAVWLYTQPGICELKSVIASVRCLTGSALCHRCGCWRWTYWQAHPEGWSCLPQVQGQEELLATCPWCGYERKSTFCNCVLYNANQVGPIKCTQCVQIIQLSKPTIMRLDLDKCNLLESWLMCEVDSVNLWIDIAGIQVPVTLACMSWFQVSSESWEVLWAPLFTVKWIMRMMLKVLKKALYFEPGRVLHTAWFLFYVEVNHKAFLGDGHWMLS